MDIEPQIEEHVREAYRAVIGKDGNRLVEAFRGLGDDDFRTAVHYGVLVIASVLNGLPGGWTDAQLREVAGRLVGSESDWVDLGAPGDVAAVLTAAAKGDLRFPGAPSQDLVGTIFVAGGYLLTSYRADGQTWWEHLDDVWAALLAAPRS